MVRRETPSAAQDPASEEARQERDSIAGDKARMEAEMLAIGARTAELRKEGAEEKARLQSSIAAARESHAAEHDALSRSMADKRRENDIIDARIAESKRAEDSIRASLTDLASREETAKAAVTSLNASIISHAAKKAEAQRDLSRLEGEARALESHKSSIQAQSFVLETRHRELTASIAREAGKASAITAGRIAGEKNIAEASRRLASTVADISVRGRELREANDSLAAARKEASEARALADAEAAAMGEKRRNLALLETRVDEKLELLARFKEKFSVDELARIKTHTSLI